MIEHRIKEGVYFIKKRILEDVKFMRSKKEIRAIERKLEEATVLKARQNIQAMFPKPAEIPQNGPFGAKP